jgi:hypothetical protein
MDWGVTAWLKYEEHARTGKEGRGRGERQGKTNKHGRAREFDREWVLSTKTHGDLPLSPARKRGAHHLYYESQSRWEALKIAPP